MHPQFSANGAVPVTDAQHVSSVNGSSFQMSSFSEPTMETPLDLNFSQRGMQSTTRTGIEFGSSIKYKQPENDGSMPREEYTAGDIVVVSSGNVQNEETIQIPVVKPKEVNIDMQTGMRGASAATVANMQQKLDDQWTQDEMIVLFDAKKVQAERAESGPRKLRSSTTGKWEEIAESCKTLGVLKSAPQCREKWEALWPAFRMIFDWESKSSEKKSSYWTMREEERVQGGFPATFDREVYNAMSTRFGLFVIALNPGAPALISLNIDSGWFLWINNSLMQGAYSHGSSFRNWEGSATGWRC
ncbi:hypothetical protein KP509_32G073200 [Ceratopteris richardii]|uniref:Myb-like domain-containing protein n=1 Tax=Ceratopteris richardii TaxID=49495 RepID=A0A8T2QWN8_CERRI|nr:hypothetical protein KP509_32G073200 [Ceratopteris richardii]